VRDFAAAVLPGVRSVVWSLVQACPDKAEDIEAETLAGLVAAIRDIDVSRPRIAVRLVGRSRKAAKRLVRLELAEQGRPATSPVPGPHPNRGGTPTWCSSKPSAWVSSRPTAPS